MSIAKRAVHSTTYNIISRIIQTLVQFSRAIALARLLEPEVFGIYAFAGSLVVLTRPLAQFGLGSALLHRAKESEGEIALRVHFTLSLILSLIWAFIMSIVGSFFMPDGSRWVLWVLVATEFLNQTTSTARVILVRRVVFRRIALLTVSSTIAATIIALLLAWRGFGVWSLVATDIAVAAILIIGYYGCRPVWRPCLGWSTHIVRYFISFGRRTFLAGLLLQALDRFDDLWTGVFLNKTQLGFYSRAYRFATYPRSILASPLNSVASGIYAELEGKPKRLSQAYFRINAFLIRSGFLLAGLLALIAPEFIRIVIGVKWLPMLAAFRLMLAFTLLDPIKITVASLFVAVGCPEKTVRARFAQLMVLVISLFIFGPRWGIAGVALAVDLMLVVGIALLLWQAKAHVQFSVIRMFAIPTLVLVLSMITARVAIIFPGVLGSPWRTGSVKAVVFSVLYITAIVLLERKQIPMFIDMIKHLRPQAIS